MIASDACKKALLSLEACLGDDFSTQEAVAFAAKNVLLIDGKKPSPLEEVVILDTLATYLLLKNDEDLKHRLFFEVFPVDKDINAYCLHLLSKLTSLAVCLGLSPVLELVSFWLKIRVSQSYCCPPVNYPNCSPQIAYEFVEVLITSLTSDLLSLRGLPVFPTLNSSERDITRSENANIDHPLYNIPFISSPFTDAFLSGLTLVYGYRPSLKSCVNNLFAHATTRAPPPEVIFCVTNWLRLGRIPKQFHQPGTNLPSNWTCIDWLSMARRYKFFSQSRFPIDQILMSQPPLLICLLWWSVFEPLSYITCSRGDPRLEKNLRYDYVAGLHHELLQCISEPAGLAAHRHGSGGAGGSGFSTWLLTCSRKMEYTKEFYYLESLVSQVHGQYNFIRSLRKRRSSGKRMNFLELMIIRLAEFMQICWVSGRIRNLSSDEFYRLLAPLECHSWINLVLTRFKKRENPWAVESSHSGRII
ncbi:unnamed protein product [Trichobilharzia szidati]|nr:unnamed protein product [Trichobilharzia szidati]